MIKIAPHIFNGTQYICTGINTMQEQLGFPLKLPYTTVFICQSGEANIQINFKNYAIKTGDILILSEEFIAIFSKITTDFKLYYCLIGRDFAAEIAYQLPNSLFSQLHHFPLCRPEKSDLPVVNTWINQLQYLYEHGKEYRSLMLRNHLQNFFLKIAENSVDSIVSLKEKYSRKELLCWKFWDLISIHSTRHRDVAFYAQQLCISPFYLSQIAKHFLNYSPKELINRQVVLEIKALLSTTELPIKTIAAQLHFEDTSYLSRYFKQQTGLTLLEFRKK